jgi:hypothetical protein
MAAKKPTKRLGKGKALEPTKTLQASGKRQHSV